MPTSCSLTRCQASYSGHSVARATSARRQAEEYMAETEGGVLISNGRCSVRLTRSGEPNELGYPTIIEVRAGPFQGSVLDSAVGYAGFREQLSALYESLLGEANIYSYEGNELVLTGNGTGGIGIRVKIIGEHVPPIQLAFAFGFDQSYLPAIIHQMDVEFPPPYRAPF